eukprot:Skav204053  [mRNA]  locus=scaffold3:301963:308610:- [translate_table: standard]
MDLERLVEVESGVVERYGLRWPFDQSAPGRWAYCLVVKKRHAAGGGFLAAIPSAFIEQAEVMNSMSDEDDAVVGPIHYFYVQGLRDTEDGQEIAGEELSVLVVDLGVVALQFLELLNEEDLEDPNMVMFGSGRGIWPDHDALLGAVEEWIAANAGNRAAFYSAVEELAEEDAQEAVEDETPAPAARELPPPDGRRRREPKAKARVTTASLAEQLASLVQVVTTTSQQMQALRQEQDAIKQSMVEANARPPVRPSQMPVSGAVAKLAMTMGSPPRTRVPPPKLPGGPQMQQAPDPLLTVQETAEEKSPLASDPMAQALLEQSKALTSLVQHLSVGDPLLEGQSSSSSSSLGVRGSAGREQLQRELAERSGNFFLKVLQNAVRRLKPASRLPTSIADVASSDFSMIQYLERFGGYGASKDLGLVQYALAHVCDALVHNDLTGAQEHLALLMIGVEQAAMDGGRWELAYRLMLLEEPPSQLWSYRNTSFDPKLKAFSPLCPQRWTTIALAYSKEIDYIQAKRAEVAAAPKAPAAPGQPQPTQPAASPKKKGRSDPLPSSSSSVRSTAIFGRGDDLEEEPKEAYGYEDVKAPFDGLGDAQDDASIPHEQRLGDSKLKSGLGTPPEFNAGDVGTQCGSLLRLVPFPSWCEQFIRQVLASKTGFSFFLLRSFLACRSGRSSDTATALFPLPIPDMKVFAESPEKPSKKARLALAQKKLLHVAVMALNYEYFRSPMSVLQLLRRRPSALHLQVYARLMALVRACGCLGGVSVAGCGRKSFELDARFQELQQALSDLGLEEDSRYHSSAAGSRVPHNDDAYEELRPYRDLDASRVKLTGKGQWKAQKYMSDLLYMVFMEPRVNRFDVIPPDGQFPDVTKGDPYQVLQLLKVWDANGLLQLVPKELGPDDDEVHLHTRIFGNYKKVDTDRQIGDRRGANYVEGALKGGPSAFLPTGVSLLQLEVSRYSEVLVGASADRKDFYHQFWVTPERASTNTLFPAFKLSQLDGTGAHEQFLSAYPLKKRRKLDREVHGDFLGRPRPLLCASGPDQPVYGAFASLLQGDHLGVEFACDAHLSLLRDAGCIQDGSNFAADEAVVHNDPATGLVIDDFFCVSRERRAFAKKSHFEGASKSASVLRDAKKKYKEEEILGSDDKEVCDSLLFKIIGAEVNSSEENVDRGLVSVGAPGEKRLGLCMLSAIAANLPYPSDSLHATLIGSWISTLLFRRCMMAHLNGLFEAPRLWPLPRRAADELVVLASLAPLIASNVAAPFAPRVYASDASIERGGVVMAKIPEEMSRVLWRTANKKGKNIPLPSRTAALHQLHDDMFEFEEEIVPEATLQVGRPIGLRYDFVEVCGGAGVVTSFLVQMNIVCCPVLDIADSFQYDIKNLQVLSWVAFMMEQGRLLAFLAAPPCTTFSPAAHPCLRSYKEPLGFCRTHPRVMHGNALAFACLALLMIALRVRVFGMVETPRRSKLRWTSMWRMMKLLGCYEALLASCSYGSIHQKEFAFLSAGMATKHLERPCTRDHTHVKIEGSYTKASATYTPGLAKALAETFRDHVLRRYRERDEEPWQPPGLEDVLTNDIAQSLDWEVVRSWPWKSKSHINLLEVAASLRVMEIEARAGGDVRYVNLVDSQVALCSQAKGRSSSLALRNLLKRASTMSVAFGLYQAGRFCTTRLNGADHPTRGTELPRPTTSLTHGCDTSQMIWLSKLRKLRRWSANWLRLSILLCPSWISFFSDATCFRQLGIDVALPQSWTLDFDSTLGFPGEGPRFQGGRFFLPCVLPLCALLLWAVDGAPSHGDAARKLQRSGIDLPEGRRVTEVTSSLRTQLLAKFSGWLTGEGSGFEELVMASPPNLDLINQMLTKYGRMLFESGKPYYQFAETINAIAVRRPILRRSLQQAWDLAFMWSSFEPCEHHQAMPHQVLLALLTTCLLWGWRREAALYALAWGAVLRMGEALKACRGDLVFPQDVGFTTDHILLRIMEPKTRFRAARHQTGKVEQPDLIQVIWLGLGDLKPHEKLWNQSSSTLRSRLDRVMLRLGLPIHQKMKVKPMTLASFRPGGATYLIALTESSELVRRRGRWASLRVMEVYLQEVSASTYMNDVGEDAKARILQAMDLFTEVLTMAQSFHSWCYPEKTWHWFFQHGLSSASKPAMGSGARK